MDAYIPPILFYATLHPPVFAYSFLLKLHVESYPFFQILHKPDSFWDVIQDSKWAKHGKTKACIMNFLD